MSRYRVVISDFQHGSPEIEERILGDLAVVETLDVRSEEEMWGRADSADAMIVYHTIRITSRTIERLTRCKLIVRCGVGFDNVDHQFARSRGIPVANVPDYGTEEVTDSAIGLMLSLARGIAWQNLKLRSPEVSWQYDHVRPLQRLSGRNFAVVGLGRIGTAAAMRAKALGMNVHFFDPYKSDGYDKVLGAKRAESLEELLGSAHVLSIHCPLTPETRNMINGRAFAMMPQGSYVVNTARGEVVDTAAIPAAIESGQLAGAGIDVLPLEPPPADHPLLVAWRDPRHPAYFRVILNAHNAFYSEQGLQDMRVRGGEACRRALLGQPLRNVVN